MQTTVIDRRSHLCYPTREELSSENGLLSYFKIEIDDKRERNRMDIRQRLSEILKLNLPKKYTSVSYAIMVDGEIVAADALGTDGSKEKRPVTLQHTYNVCSISKIFCTVAVMKLVEQGKVELDRPICEYLPQFTMLDPRYRQITVRHCLNHASGLPGTQWKHFSAIHVGQPDNQEYYDEVYNYLAKCYLKADPGTYSVYCNDGFTLAEMLVAKVSGMSFGEFCKQYITEPIGAHSTRVSTTLNPEYPLIQESGKPKEEFYLQGCGGFTTTMTDLCKFGNLFLTENPIISEESKAEMRKMQGVTFLPEDTASTRYGLGWDNVCVEDPEFDLGEQVQLKGGNSFQFTSKLYILPKYHAVLTISETHDCKMDVGLEILRLFAVYLQEVKGISIYQKYQPVPQQLIDQFDGIYLVPSQIYHTHFFGTDLTITNDNTSGERVAVYKNLKYDGTNFVAENGEKFFFRSTPQGTYLFTTNSGKVVPMAMKAENHPALSEQWKQRIGKRYLAVDLTEQDIVCGEMMNGFVIRKLDGVEGVLVASFSSVPDGEIYGNFEGAFVPEDELRGNGFLLTPSNGSRDLLCPCFEERDGVEYCYVGSYLYKEEGALEDYQGQQFADLPVSQENNLYRLTDKLESLPEVPAGRRLMILNEKMEAVYDSQNPKDYKPVEKGYISFI